MTRSDVVPLARALEAFRRRRRRVLALRFLGTALAVSVVAGEALALVFGTTAAATAWLLAGAAAAAVVASFGAAVARTPSLSGTARLLDRRASLKNRAATALQFVQQDDPMARLVVRDAMRRIEGLDPALVFPREAPGRALWLVAAVAVSTLILGAHTWRAAKAPRAGAPRSGGLVVPGAPNQASPAGAPTRPNEPAPVQPAQAAARATVPGTPVSPPRESVQGAAEAPQGLTKPTHARAVPARQEAAVTAAPAASRVPPGRSSSPIAANRQPATATAGSGSARGAARAGPGGRGAGAEGAIEPGRSHEGGGVKGGALDARTVPASRRAGEAGRPSAVEYPGRMGPSAGGAGRRARPTSAA